MTGTKVNYGSDIIMGDLYRDTLSGFEGHATGVFFYQYGCERVNVEAFDKTQNDIRSLTFDAPRLIHVKTGNAVTVEKTGGPGRGNEVKKDSAALR